MCVKTHLGDKKLLVIIHFKKDPLQEYFSLCGVKINVFNYNTTSWVENLLVFTELFHNIFSAKMMCRKYIIPCCFWFSFSRIKHYI